MANLKDLSFTFRVKREIKEALRTCADIEHRSLSNMFEMLLRRHAEKIGVEIISPDEVKS